MSAFSRGLQGAAGGAAIGGSLGGPVGAGIGGGLGLLTGGLFGGDEEEAQKRKIKKLQEMAIAYQAMRPELAQTNMNALNQSLGALGPSNQAIGDMYGSRYMLDLEALGQNPMTPGMMDPGVGEVSKLQGKIDGKLGKKFGFAYENGQMVPNKPGYSAGLNNIG